MAAVRLRQIMLNSKPSSGAMVPGAALLEGPAALGTRWLLSPFSPFHPVGPTRIGLVYQICSVPSSAVATVTGGSHTPRILKLYLSAPTTVTGSLPSRRHIPFPAELSS